MKKDPSPKRRSGYWNCFLPMSGINVLPQPRKTFDPRELKELADSIKAGGLINPVIVARFDRPQMEKYLSVINGVWKTDFQISDLKQTGIRFHVLIAGERRFRAHKILKRREIECRIPHEENPILILSDQFQENVHAAVPKHEEAISHASLFRFLKQIKPQYTRAQFAREMGKSPDVIRDAERFCDLPDFIFRAASERIGGKYAIPYSIALEFGRLHQAGMSQKDIKLEMDLWKARPKNLHEFHRAISRAINLMGQSLLDIFEKQNELAEKRRNVRGVFQSEIIASLQRFDFYWKTAIECFESGRLGHPNSPFAEGSVVRLYRKQVGHMKDVFAHLKSFLPKRELKKIEQILRQAELAIDQIEKK